MSQIIVDSEMGTRLLNTLQPVEFVDGSGKVLGHFMPATSASSFRLRPQVSDEELRRREEQGGGRPLADILADLETRG